MRIVRGLRIGWVGVAVVLVLAFLATGFAPPRSDAAAEPVVRTVDSRISEQTRTELRREFLAITNEDRAERDREDLRLARLLSRYATRHSRQMADQGHIFHSTEEGLRGALDGTEWSVAGENVGVGSSLDGLQDAFMDSSAHRRNILNRGYDHTAIGVVVAHDRVWITVVFYGD